MKRVRLTSPDELAICGLLREAGYAVEHQYPVGPYNVDAALHEPMIAVEITHGHPRSDGRVGDSLRRQRVEYLRGNGWNVVALVISKSFGRRFGSLDAAKHLISNLDLIRRNPAAPGQYWVTACRCDSMGRPSYETHQRAAI
jgi:hypothetical protein